jgi:acylphosphatase
MHPQPASLVRIQIRYTGRVQGVGFRATCRDIAKGHPVTGWVRNEPDGTVLLEAQGPPPAVESFLRAIDATMARFITAAPRTPATLNPSESGFEIRR